MGRGSWVVGCGSWVWVVGRGSEIPHVYTSCIQLFRERLSYKLGKAYVTLSKVIMGNGGFYSCLIESQGVSVWWKETAQGRVSMLSPFLLLNHFKPQSSKP